TISHWKTKLMEDPGIKLFGKKIVLPDKWVKDWKLTQDHDATVLRMGFESELQFLDTDCFEMEFCF
ncbi:hypothetical protein Tco_0657576, partial [Tanacetum coccineum]